MFGSHKRLEKKLRANGTSAEATVLNVRRLGVEHVEGPGRVSSVVLLCRLKLRVEPPGEPAFDATTTARLPNRRKPDAGARIGVLYDPEDHKKLVVDLPRTEPGDELAARLRAVQGTLDAFSAQPAPAAGDPLDQLAKLAELHEAGALTDGEFADQKRRILGEG